MKPEQSDHFDGKLFFNPGVDIDKPFSELIKWQRHRTPKPWPKWVENKSTPLLRKISKAGELDLTFINHVTFLGQLDGCNFLTDPVFVQRTSPVQWAGPRRVRRPGLELEQLPRIDFIVVSHNHYDHMDLASLDWLIKKFDPLIVVPLGNIKYFRSIGDAKVVELDWWQSHCFNNIEITLTPAQHWSARGLWDRRKALWGGFYIRDGRQRIYFAGDTGYCSHFSAIRERLGPPDLSLLPIGAYEPRWFMKLAHMNPADAVQAHLDLESNQSIGMHFGTWQMTDEGFEDPLIELEKAKALRQIASINFSVLEVGETRTIKSTAT
jgi:L-ascorbate metabolism protein UlaG (beta-lactamase superfamily)